MPLAGPLEVTVQGSLIERAEADPRLPYSRLLRAEGFPAVIAPVRVPKEEPDRHAEHLKLDAVDQVLAVPVADPWPDVKRTRVSLPVVGRCGSLASFSVPAWGQRLLDSGRVTPSRQRTLGRAAGLSVARKRTHARACTWTKREQSGRKEPSWLRPN